MKELEAAPRTMRCRHPRWIHLILASTVLLGLGLGQGEAAQNNPKKPILTKSGKQAAVLQAAADILAAPMAAMPVGPTDQTKVPHYFGPFPNWANSPYTLPDVAVTITGDGAGATATATVGANGAVTGITITNPGSGYTAASVTFIGVGTGATADALVNLGGAVTGITVATPGSGYTAPTVSVTGGGATTDATATAFGGVDAVAIVTGGSGYSMPTVDFDLPDGTDGVPARAHALMDATGAVTAVVVDDPGSGYSSIPNVIIRDGTVFDPVRPGGSGATVAATLSIQSVVLATFGAGYTSTPTVTITDASGTGSGATATAVTDVGAITAINLTAAGSGYLTAGGIRKFTDPLPGLCNPPGCPSYLADPAAKYIPLAVPEVKTYNGVEADEYVIGLVQYRTSFSSSLPPTLVRGYVQLETAANAASSQHFPLANANLDPLVADAPILINGVQALAVTPPQYLGPIIAATRDRPVRIVFHNLLPTGSGGDLFLPTDSSLMGSGMGPMAMVSPADLGTVMDEVRNPMCTEYPKPAGCFKDNRADLHLHGGVSPWISDGTPHQWITPAGEGTPWPEGVSVENVPDMNVCGLADDGCQTYYYTNQQSARLMFYHDHSWGITRLNVYSGEAAGYLITDATEQALLSSGTIPGAADTIPLIIQDKTFVPDIAQLAQQDPTWDVARWGGYGNIWNHHVYMPAQNPGDPGGMSAFGRWMYGPWFWPPAAATMYGPIANPYYNMDPATNFTTPLLVPCNLDDPTTWQYQTDPFCEPAQIPGTPNISVGMEQFNDTPIVNGVAYPTLTLEPKTYRLRILSVANDRFFNFQWYVADPGNVSTDLNSQGVPIGGTEVALKAAELAAAQLNPVVSPNPDTAVSLPGPDWIQIGTEGGFLPAPVVVDGQQVTTWITDPTRFDVGNVDLHSLLLAPAERADVIVDFSAFAGQTLILYNDAPAAFPARVPSYDYYMGAPDLSPVGAPTILPGYGPNTRTIMQVKIAASAPAPAFDLAKLRAAFLHKANGTGVFESGQHPIIVGQAAYNSAYGTTFAASSNCNAPGSTVQRCDGYVRVSDTQSFGFNTLRAPNAKMTIPLQPKAIHDEMNATTFDEYGRMQANLGIEAQPPTPGLQNVTLYPFVNPQTELIDATGLPVGDINVTAISSATDGTQIWRITHNGVDTHPIHFHLYDVQLINRVTWDNIIIQPDATELGWKDTVRMAPLEDTIVALRPIIPTLPFEIPNSIRNLNPMLPTGSSAMFNNTDPQGNPTANIVNDLVNFGWEYVYHCHILSHEEMDMMRPVSVALPPIAPNGLAFSITGTGNNRRVVLTWNDNSITETSFLVQRTTNGITWTNVGTSPSPLMLPNIHEMRSFTDATSNATTAYLYRVVALNTVGYGGAFPSLTVQSVSANLGVNLPAVAPAAPTSLTATLQAGTQIRLAWMDNATDEAGFVIERAIAGGPFNQIAVAPARNNTGNVTFVDNTVTPDATYNYRVAAINLAGWSAYSNLAIVAVPAAPVAPASFRASNGPNGGGNNRTVILNWVDLSNNETSFTIQRATNAAFTAGLNTATVAANATTLTQTGRSRNTNYYYRIRANNGLVSSAWVNATPLPITTNP